MEYRVKQFNNRGLISLLNRPRTGRPSRISDEIMEKIDQELRQNPHDFGYNQNMRNGILLRQHLSDHYGIDMGVSQCQNIFLILGFRIRRPRPTIAKGDM
ncbi:MAG: helix-turn-helix domain-containing protein [Candidatus Thermoplasmatota archaeon]|nr:helix-turn-helix domain-containing protein [Candidatus Thermoplasmatota archaeon]MCL5438246.1 helix-turn-helix domain-containing protein [Candidatus Thermoplasmatota archaeon]